ncbi:unnamed protein product [Bursaphelenchus okinawaensis]|uniref:Uncharacterized protein n=1 Tax=Bursaphelenchus okinawaensis TaxID=465554 RepID=A0A811JS65_9BILA|nr:unnamed protein product [Bursaphelenchus okinawaensis]CAG9080621.1 unnamed protein product [Bursaphelenchus okinawaensis]
MRILVESLQPELWCIIIKHQTIMDDTVSLAMVNKRFYKLVKLNFKQLCYDHAVYRRKGETWAYAFLNLGHRLFNEIRYNKTFYVTNAICCSFTGKMALKLENGYVLLTNIDFGLNQFTILDFTSYTEEITGVSMINRGTELLVRTPNVVLVYDLHSMKVTGPQYKKNGKFEFPRIQHGTIFDFYSKKEFKIDAKLDYRIHNVNIYDKSKYTAVHTTDDKLVVINNDTDERFEVCEWTVGMSAQLIDEMDSVVVQSFKIAARIYSIKHKQIVFDYQGFRCYFLNSTTLIDPFKCLFISYNKQMTRWQEVKVDPSLLLQRYFDYCDVGFLPVPKNTLMESFQNGDSKLIYLTFKNGHARAKTFNAKPKRFSRKLSWSSYPPDGDHPIIHLANLTYSPNDPKEFYNQLTRLHFVKPSVSLVEASTGITEYFNFCESD